MATRILRDKDRNPIGEIETDHNGIQIARDVNRNIVGAYDPTRNTTYDKNNNPIGEGNLLSSILVPPKHNTLAWGVGGFLLGEMHANASRRQPGTSREEHLRDDGSSFLVNLRDGVLGCLFLGSLIGIVVLGVHEINGDRYDSFPARQIAAIYHHGLFVPLATWISLPWHYIYTQSLTDYPNLNLVLAIGAIAMIAVVVVCITIFFPVPLIRIFGRFGWWPFYVFWFVVVPGFVCGPWLFWGGWIIYRWLSVPSK